MAGKDITTTDWSNVDTTAASFSELLAIGGEAGFYTVPGFTVVDQYDLLGVPFVVTGVRFHAPIPDKSKPGGKRDYVSLECTAGDKETIGEQIRRRRIVKEGGVVVDSIDEMFVSPEERFIVNDGSTGIRRQIVGMLDHPSIGLIEVGHPGEDNRLDYASTDWADNGEQTWETSDGYILPYVTRKRDGAPLLIFARRGLHASRYTNEYGESVTFYL